MSTKFEDMLYSRPDPEAVKEALTSLTNAISTASDYLEARSIFIKMDETLNHWDTASTLVHIRHSINTEDEFYDKEQQFFDDCGPEIKEYVTNFRRVLRESPFREDFVKDYGNLIFTNTDIFLRSFSPEIIEPSKEENQLVTRYEKLIASAQIPFEGGIYTLSQLTPFKQDADDEKRLSAWKAEGTWYKENQGELDDIYDKLTHLRDSMGRTMGHENYIGLGYDRMSRNSYTKEDVESFRKAVVEHLVPVADKIYRRQAKRLGKNYPLSFADAALQFRDGNPKPAGDEAYIVKVAKKFYDELSPETSEFFNFMIDNNLMDLSSKKGKRGGGYCTSIPDYQSPFIFANFNNTQGDIEVVTHEAGHAFEAYVNRARVPSDYIYPSMEACEVHSMSMEFFGELYAEDFFGKDANKFLYSHLAGAITFIPYGTMVDHFQHIVYENPSLTPAERHGKWRSLLGIYMPWLAIDGDIPFYGEGEGWQRQMHIYAMPFYYIDYCLAQTVALQFWALIQNDRKAAFKRYLDYTNLGGSLTFTELLRASQLESPFDASVLKNICEKASAFLDTFDY